METLLAPLTAGIPQDNTNPLAAELERPAMEAEQQQQQQQAKWLYDSQEKLQASLLDPSKLDFDFSQASDPELAKKRSLVRGYLLLENQGQPLPGGEMGFEVERRRIARDRFQGQGIDNEMEFFNAIQNEATQKQTAKELEDEMQRTVIQSATITTVEGSQRASKFTDWLKEAKTKPGYQPGQDFRYRELWEETQSEVKDTISRFEQPIKEVWTAIKAGGLNYAAKNAYYSTPEADREEFMTALSVMADALPAENKNEFFLNLSKQTGRDVASLGSTMLEGVKDFSAFTAIAQNPTNPETGGKSNLAVRTQIDIEERNFRNDIKRLRDGQFDPVKRLAKSKTMKAIEGGIYAAPGAIATTAVMAVPGVGTFATLMAMQGAATQDTRQRLLDQGVSDKDATAFSSTWGSTIGAIQLIPESIGFSAITRKNPLLNKVFTKISDKVTSRLARFAVTSAAVGTIETGTEITQDLIPALWIDAAAAFNEDIPGTDWDAEFQDFGYHTLETFVACLPLALFGGAGGVNQEARNQAFATADPLTRQAYGITPEDNAAIDAAKAKGPSSLNQAIENALDNKDPGSESSIDAVQQIAEATVKAKELAAQAEAAGLFPTIVHDSESNTFTLYDQKTNEEIGTATTAEDAVKLAATHTDSIDMEHADRVAFVTTILQGQQASTNFQTQGAAAGIGRTITSEARLGETLTAAQAAAGNPAALARIAAQSRLREQTEGGDGTITDVVFGQSITDPTSLNRGMRTTVNRIQQGATILTVFHEETHGFWREAQAQGRLTQDEAITFLKGLDTLGQQNRTRGKQYQSLLRADFDTLNDYDKKVAVDEAISEWMEAEILRSRKGKGSRNLPPGLVSQNLSALARIVGDKNVGKFRSFIRAIRDYFGIALDRAFIIQQALASGDLKKEDYDTFIDKLHGLTEQTNFDQMVKDADTALTQNFDEQAYIDQEFPDGDPFSIGRAQVTPGPSTQSFQGAEGSPDLIGPASFSIGAYHGTPHKVDKFSTEKIGTGEGAQAYGWGLYFAAAKDVAKQYADKLSIFKGDLTIDGTIFDGQRHKLQDDVDMLIADAWKDIKNDAKTKPILIRELKNRAKGAFKEWKPRFKAAIEKAQSDAIQVNSTPGTLYTVALNVEEDQLLDYDKPLSKQSISIKKALGIDETDTKSLSEKLKALEAKIDPETFDGSSLQSEIAAVERQLNKWNISVRDYYDNLAKNNRTNTPGQRSIYGDNSAKVSQEIYAKGIKGIRYLDSVSRDGGDGTYNYVIFNESDITITEENGQLVNLAEPSFSIGKPWPADFPKVTIHTTVGKMKSMPGYTAAKAGDTKAAFEIVDSLVKINRMEALGKLHPGAIVVALHGEEATGMNKLPQSLAESLSHHAGLELDEEIVMLNKPKRTGSTAMHRLASRPQFTGTVQAGKKYILADDVATQGGTLSEARAYIEENGGIVVDTLTLAAAQGGTILALDPKTELALLEKFNEKALDEFATKTGLYQGQWQALTNSEANALLKFNSLATAAERILAGRQEANDSGTQTTPQSESLDTSFSLGIDKSKINSYFKASHEGEKLTEATDKTLDLFAWATSPASNGGRSSNLQREAAQTSSASDSSRDGELIAELIRQASNPAIPSNPSLPQQIQEAIDKKQGKPLSIILSEMIERKIPNWNPIGQKAESEQDIFALNSVFRNPWFESLRVMAVDKNFKVIAAEVQTVGTLSETPVDYIGMLNFILRAQEIDPEAKLIFSHNHPSGNPNPSRADMRITDSLKEIAKEIGVTILDHVITNGTKGFSFSSQSQFTVSKEMDVDWTSIDRTSLPALDNPDISQNLGFALRAANTSATWIAYVDAQLQIRAINILPTDKQEAARTIIKDAGLVGAAGIITFIPDFNRETKALMDFVNELAGKLNLRYLDSIFQNSSDPSNSFSAKSAGMMEDPAALSIGQSKLADLLRDDATSRIRNPEVRAKALSRIARNLEGLRLEAEKLELQIGNKRLRKSLQREAAVRQAMRFEQLENEALARHSGILSDEDLTVLTAQPIHSNLVEEYRDNAGRKRKRGLLMSRTQAAKRHPDMFTRDSAGEYDGADGMPSILFGGTRMPDQAADDLYRAGLIKDPYPDTMWAALSREQNSVSNMKEALESAKADLRAARATSQTEAKDWLQSQIGNQELNFTPKEEILRASAMLDAILTALPAELRGQIGGYTPLARLGSDETRLAFLRDRLARADRLLENYLKKEFDKQFRKLLDRARPEKDEVGKRPKGKIGADVHALFQDIRDAMLLNGAETEAMVASLDILAGDSEITPEQSAHLTIQSNLTSLVGNWRNASADRMEAAVIEGERIFARGYLEQITKNLRKAERYRTQRTSLKTATGQSGERMERVNRAIEDAKKKSIPKQFFTSLLSFEQILTSAFGRDSKEANDMVDWERRASSAKHDATFNAQTLLEDLFTTLAGGKYKGEQLRWEMSKPKTITVKDGFGNDQTFSELTAISATMMWRQEDGRRHMEGHVDEDGNHIGQWHWTDDAMDDIENQLSDNAKAVRLHLTERYATEYDRLNAIYVDLYGVSLPKHKLYSPITVKQQQTMGGQTNDPVTGYVTRRPQNPLHQRHRRTRP